MIILEADIIKLNQVRLSRKNRRIIINKWNIKQTYLTKVMISFEEIMFHRDKMIKINENKNQITCQGCIDNKTIIRS
jgi:hypothetical protein